MLTMLTVKQTADRLQVNPMTIRRYIKNGQMPFVRLSPKAIRIYESDLEKFLASSKLRYK